MKRKTITLLLAGLCTAALLGGCTSKSSKEISEAGTVTPVPETDESVDESVLADIIDIQLSDDVITADGTAIDTDTASAVYKANDIVFYLEGQDFTYGEGSEEDEHSQAEADAHTVVHITQPGSYRLSGELSAGQIAVDLGEDADKDPNAVVNLILDNVDITCTVAPAVIFYNVYECGSDDEEDAAYTVDTMAAGANVIIADESQNNITGSHVARIYKSVVLNDDGTEVTDSEKLHKYDAAFYSKRTMNVTGESKGSGVLNIVADNEGLDSEFHLTINGGNINIESGNDGINTNEDGISVTTINGGNLTINVTGSTGEGDGIDSNGWLVINGGSVTAAACGFSGDAGIDSDMGIYLNGGSVAATGNMLDAIAGTEQNYAVFQFSSSQKGGNTYTLKNANNDAVGEWTPANDFTYMIIAGPKLFEGTYTFWRGEEQISGTAAMGGMGDFGGGMRPGGEIPEDMEIPEGMERPKDGEFPEDMERPEDAEFPEDMERPEDGKFPEGMERPEDGKFPEGMERPEDGKFPEGMERPEGDRGFGGRGGMNGRFTGEVSTEFVIRAGGNQFICS